MDLWGYFIGSAALLISALSLFLAWRTSRQQQLLTEEQVRLSARQVQAEEGSLQFQLAMAFKDACVRLIDALKAQKRNALALAVGRIVLRWTRDGKGDLRKAEVVRNEIVEATGIDLDFFIDTGKIRRNKRTKERRLP